MGKLVWLAAYPKSGTTWLRAFLHNYILQPEAPHHINQMLALSTGETGAAHYARHDPRPASAYSTEDVQRLRPLVHRELTRLHPDLVFVKTHNASLAMHGIPLLTPAVTAGAIYLLRDPRDVAVSYSHHLGVPLDEVIAFMADPDATLPGDDRKVFERLGSWSIHVHYWTRHPDPRLCVLRYEDLLRDPGQGFARIVSYLGFPPDAARLDRAVRFSAFGELQAQEQRDGFGERPPHSAAFFRAGLAGAWRNVLSPTQSARIAAQHHQEMRRFGYL